MSTFCRFTVRLPRCYDAWRWSGVSRRVGECWDRHKHVPVPYDKRRQHEEYDICDHQSDVHQLLKLTDCEPAGAVVPVCYRWQHGDDERRPSVICANIFHDPNRCFSIANAESSRDYVTGMPASLSFNSAQSNFVCTDIQGELITIIWDRACRLQAMNDWAESEIIKKNKSIWKASAVLVGANLQEQLRDHLLFRQARAA